MSWISGLARPEIVALEDLRARRLGDRVSSDCTPTSCPGAPPGDESDAGLNRYPEPQPRELIARLAALYDVAPASVLAGRGSDEMIDLLVRVFCRAGQDGILICPPTFGMYAVSAAIQGAQVVDGAPACRAAVSRSMNPRCSMRCTAAVKLVFLCSPNNPTGNLLDEAALLRIAARLQERAVLVVDEAYVEFAGVRSLARHIDSHTAPRRTADPVEGAWPRGRALRSPDRKP